MEFLNKFACLKFTWIGLYGLFVCLSYYILYGISLYVSAIGVDEGKLKSHNCATLEPLLRMSCVVKVKKEHTAINETKTETAAAEHCSWIIYSLLYKMIHVGVLLLLLLFKNFNLLLHCQTHTRKRWYMINETAKMYIKMSLFMCTSFLIYLCVRRTPLCAFSFFVLSTYCISHILSIFQFTINFGTLSIPIENSFTVSNIWCIFICDPIV